MSDELQKKDYLTTTQAARLLSVSPDTVLKWVKAGKVKSYRTLGGHFRIPTSELNIPESSDQEPATLNGHGNRFPVHQYCWEYLAAGGEIKPECKDCITFRSRAKRCYQLKGMPEGMGCLNIMCDTECSDCEYFKLVNEQAQNILILSETNRLIEDPHGLSDSIGIDLRIAVSEYDAAVMIQDFRPDYIIVDCSFGKKRTAVICSNLFNDIRIPVPRVILSSKTKNIHDYCNNEVFSWIKKPFSVTQLIDCIRGVPQPNGTG
ncbi:MAG: excisionase family DNA-binding protein [FCB group bacterium]|nr:excisionase family DNA-binding protein [FCB group bacterium]